jgi:hypothetical protein
MSGFPDGGWEKCKQLLIIRLNLLGNATQGLEVDRYFGTTSATENPDEIWNVECYGPV